MNLDNQNFIDRLKELMKENNLNLSSLSKKIPCSKSIISSWLNGKTLPRYSTLILLSDLFNCSVDFILGLSENDDFEKSETPENFNVRFKALLGIEGVSQYQFAKLHNFSEANVSRWMKDVVPCTLSLIELARHFNRSIDFIIGRSKD